ncbi:hypothetical protein [Trinickia mobilis]|uniref:hypothetical protein n=1 Tax=Trinickia mobilis TaxID=2816356 RepID=UPI001A90BEC2|nr:hypothetical protein [Trinickia mobilis]
MKRLSLIVFLIAIGGCSKYNNEKWVALQDMQAFAEPNDDRAKPIFLVKQGETCAPLEDSVARIYAYTKMRCASGTGWVLDDFFQKSSK